MGSVLSMPPSPQMRSFWSEPDSSPHQETQSFLSVP